VGLGVGRTFSRIGGTQGLLLLRRRSEDRRLLLRCHAGGLEISLLRRHPQRFLLCGGALHLCPHRGLHRHRLLLLGC
jgi:hypothetical protein